MLHVYYLFALTFLFSSVWLIFFFFLLIFCSRLPVFKTTVVWTNKWFFFLLKTVFRAENTPLKYVSIYIYVYMNIDSHAFRLDTTLISRSLSTPSSPSTPLSPVPDVRTRRNGFRLLLIFVLRPEKIQKRKKPRVPPSRSAKKRKNNICNLPGGGGWFAEPFFGWN